MKKRLFIPAGEHEDLVFTFDEDMAPQAGGAFHTRLHADDPADQAFTFTADPSTDRLETFGFGVESGVTHRTRVLAPDS